MGRIEDARQILAGLGLPGRQQNDISALTLLALANITPRKSWKEAEQRLIGIHDMLRFFAAAFKREYAENSRESVRRQVLHQFVQARVADLNPDDPARPTNSGKTVYALSKEALTAIRAFGTPRWKSLHRVFLAETGSLRETYEGVRRLHQLPLVLPDGHLVTLSPGAHNELQAAIVQDFGPRFAPGARVLYLGDTANKDLLVDREQLSALNFPMTEHDKLPDVVLFDEKRRWLFLIEAVTSHGPVSPKRHHELEGILAACPAGIIYVSAFLDRSTFRKYAADIAWESEAWIRECPDHLIHFNGDRFLGPHARRR